MTGRALAVLMLVLILCSGAFAGYFGEGDGGSDPDGGSGPELPVPGEEYEAGNIDFYSMFRYEDEINGIFDYSYYFEKSKGGSLFLAEPSFYYSENCKMSMNSFRWIFASSFKVSLSLPYIFRSVESSGAKYSTSGIGDSRAALSYYLPFGNIKTLTEAGCLLPTGDESASDGGYYLPLGNGGAAFSLSESLDYRITSLRFFGSLGLTYHTSSEINGNGAALEQEKGMLMRAGAGTEYSFAGGLKLFARLSYYGQLEGRVRADGSDWVDAGDDFTRLEASGGLRYFLLSDRLEADLVFSAPVISERGDNASSVQDDSFGLSFKVLLSI